MIIHILVIHILMFMLPGSICKFSLRERSEKLRTVQNLENGFFTTDFTCIFNFPQISHFRVTFVPLPKRGSKRFLKRTFHTASNIILFKQISMCKRFSPIYRLSQGKLKSPIPTRSLYSQTKQFCCFLDLA